MIRRLFVVLVLSIVCIDDASVSQVFSAYISTPAQQDQRCFAETGQCISGRFRQYWEQNGGLAVFGFPITAASDELSVDGGTYLTQWFERNRFELHTDKAAPYDVLLGRLGDDRLRQLEQDWQQFPKGQQTVGCAWFVETRHSVCEPFKSYWERNGLQDPSLNAYGKSLALFGLPISEASVETNVSGATVVMQWFERARFECFPQNVPEYQVQLGLLGNEVRTNTAIPAAGPVVLCSVSATPPPVAPAPGPQPGCDAAYPDFCIPSPPPDLDCGDIGRSNFRVLAPDPHRLDADGDGIGCENGAPGPGPQPTAGPPAPTSPPANPTARPQPSPTPRPSQNCDPSYPTVCIPPPPPDLNCDDIPHKRFKVLPPDPHGFDGRDNDGIGCET